MDQAFLRGETWAAPGAAVEHIETHAAHVFLVGSHAYKIKKDVKLPYLDFSTVSKRRQVLLRELDINRVHAPQIYDSVIEVRGEPVLKMNRFDNAFLLRRLIRKGRLDRHLALQLADMAAAAHDIAPVAGTAGGDIMAGLGAQLSQAFTSSPDIFPAAETLEFHALYEASLGSLKGLLNYRSGRGLVRRCHGDMHCGNIVVINNQPVLFDAIEFSDDIATIDVLYDLAFLLMDLLRLGRADAANLVMNAYLDRRRREEDLSGLTALPLFLATRAGVRALVAADLAHELPIDKSLKPRGEALDYFRASLSFLDPSRAILVCVGGLSGTGKSVLAGALAPRLGPPPGAIHIRSDVERKMLAGIPECHKLPASSYTPLASLQVYDSMLDRAERALRAGQAVILDAVFAQESKRRSAERLAAMLGVPFEGLWLEAPAGTLKERVDARTGDASDATSAVVDRQLAYDLGHLSWHRIDAGGTMADTFRRASETLRCQPAVRA